MSRSLKKGPFVDFKLARKVAALGADDRTVIKTWARASTITPEMVGRTIPYTTAAYTFLCLLRKTWLVISSVSLAQHASSANTVERIENNG